MGYLYDNKNETFHACVTFCGNTTLGRHPHTRTFYGNRIGQPAENVESALENGANVDDIREKDSHSPRTLARHRYNRCGGLGALSLLATYGFLPVAAWKTSKLCSTLCAGITFFGYHLLLDRNFHCQCCAPYKYPKLTQAVHSVDSKIENKFLRGSFSTIGTLGLAATALLSPAKTAAGLGTTGLASLLYLIPSTEKWGAIYKAVSPELQTFSPCKYAFPGQGKPARKTT